MTSTPNLYTCTKEQLMEVAGLSATKATKILNLRKKGQVEMHDLATVTGPGTNWDNLLETGRISLEKSPDAFDCMKKEVQLLREQLREQLEQMKQMKIQIEERDRKPREYEQERSCNASQSKEIDEVLDCAMKNEGVEERQGSTKPSSHPFDDKYLLGAYPKDGIYTSSRVFGARTKEAASDTLINKYTPVGVKRESVGELDSATGERHTIEKRDKTEHHDTPDNFRKKGRMKKDDREFRARHQTLSDEESSMSSSSAEDSFDSESSDESLERERRRKGTQHRRRSSPPGPKLPTFSGNPAEWDAFLYLFNGTARHYQWGSDKKLQRLKECMRDKAIDYVRSRSRKERNDYRKLMKCLKNRYGVKEDPSVVRRNLNDIKQEVNESLEDFADRVQHAVAVGYKGAGERAIEKWAAELFLKGAKEKGAALAASERQPRSIRKALREMKISISNQKAVLGRTLSVSARQVAFDDEVLVRATYPSSQVVGCHTTTAREVRCQEPVGSGKVTLDEKFEQLLQRVTRLEERDAERPTPPVHSQFRRYSRSPNNYPSADRQSPGRGQSPSFSGRCYNCGETGHMSRHCSRSRSRSPSAVSGNIPLKE